jgi:hypothetical protein
VHERNIRQVDTRGHMHFISCDRMTIFINLLFILAFLIQKICANEPVVVHTQYGNVLGYQTDLARVFYSIPFAESPTGSLR